LRAGQSFVWGDVVKQCLLLRLSPVARDLERVNEVDET
jgi:hypothetical protein